MRTCVFAAAVAVSWSGAAASAEEAPAVAWRLKACASLPKATGKSVEFWMPAPREDAFQQLSSIHFPAPGRLTRDPATGNRFVHFSFPADKPAPAEICVEFEVIRHPFVASGPTAEPTTREAKAPDPLARWKLAEPGLPIDDKVKQLSAKVVGDATANLAKARKIFDAIRQAEEGAGDVKAVLNGFRNRGLDADALFVACCRAQGLAARRESGRQMSKAGANVEVAPASWAAFALAPGRWTPVAFGADGGIGALANERVGFTIGVDATLVPPGKTPASRLGDPILQMDGKPVPMTDGADGFRVRWSASSIADAPKPAGS